MVDLETMSSQSNAAIVSIGACKFSVENGIEDKFYMVSSLSSSIAHNMHADGNTIMWWMQQSDEARNALKGGVDIVDVLRAFHNWYDSSSDALLWGNGATFDNVVLANAYKSINMPKPWSYKQDACYRTMKNMFADVPFPERVGTHHNALDDAINQANHLIEIFKKLGIK